jgi:hypothetical protein
MGYRSKVIIGVKEGLLSDRFDDMLKKNNYNPTKSNDYLKISDTDGYKTYLFDYVKWYVSDDWCKEIMDWLDKTQLNKLDDCWSLGMGEDGQIHSEIGDWYEYVDVFYDIELQNN